MKKIVAGAFTARPYWKPSKAKWPQTILGPPLCNHIKHMEFQGARKTYRMRLLEDFVSFLLAILVDWLRIPTNLTQTTCHPLRWGPGWYGIETEEFWYPENQLILCGSTGTQKVFCVAVWDSVPAFCFQIGSEGQKPTSQAVVITVWPRRPCAQT